MVVIAVVFYFGYQSLWRRMQSEHETLFKNKFTLKSKVSDQMWHASTEYYDPSEHISKLAYVRALLEQ